MGGYREVRARSVRAHRRGSGPGATTSWRCRFALAACSAAAAAVAVVWSIDTIGAPQVVSVRASSKSETVPTSGAQGSPLSATTTMPQTNSPAVSAPPSGPVSKSPAATRACQARLAQYAWPNNPHHVVLVAEYATTAGDVAADETRSRGPQYRSEWAVRPPGEPEAVCFFDGDPEAFAAFPPTVTPSARAAFPDRVEEVVRPDGLLRVYARGHRATFSPSPIVGVGR